MASVPLRRSRSVPVARAILRGWIAKLTLKRAEMAHSEYTVHTWECNGKGCAGKVTLSGNLDQLHDTLHDEGWSLGETILGRENIDLCPDCTKEVAQFLFGENK